MKKESYEVTGYVTFQAFKLPEDIVTVDAINQNLHLPLVPFEMVEM